MINIREWGDVIISRNTERDARRGYLNLKRQELDIDIAILEISKCVARNFVNKLPSIARNVKLSVKQVLWR